ncbi:hypothetical protein B5M09_011402 [Aphanomyces astaci]|uniref:Uncharacterized protein n=1 Tax=Aphanomyces astaci TaxID=112090 RepID=A0A3R7Y8G7_APHAT|nr:hypothetical protein B5M09_011402 [Aphanomyces astaci]
MGTEFLIDDLVRLITDVTDKFVEQENRRLDKHGQQQRTQRTRAPPGKLGTRSFQCGTRGSTDDEERGELDGIVAVLSVRAVELFGELVSDLDEGRLGLLAATGFATREAVTVTEALEQTQYALVAGAKCFPGKIRA